VNDPAIAVQTFPPSTSMSSNAWRSARRRDGRKIICGPEQKAGKGIRTLDIQLGKLTLYQLSYARAGGGV